MKTLFLRFFIDPAMGEQTSNSQTDANSENTQTSKENSEGADANQVEADSKNEENNNDDEPLGEKGLAALKAERANNKNLKERLATLEKQITQMEKAKTKSVQTLQAEIEKTRAIITKYKTEEEHRTWKQEAAEEYGVPIEALRGKTQTEYFEHAKQLREMLNNTPPSTPVVPNIQSSPATSSTSYDPRTASLRKLINEVILKQIPVC